MKKDYPWIDCIDQDVRDFIHDLQNGGYGITVFASTLKHVEMILDNLFLLNEDMEREVLGSLIAALNKGQMRLDGDDKMTVFMVSMLYQMIKRDDMFSDVIFIREEIHPEEWEDDNNDDQNQNNNGKDSSKD